MCAAAVAALRIGLVLTWKVAVCRASVESGPMVAWQRGKARAAPRARLKAKASATAAAFFRCGAGSRHAAS
eukprot:11108057-Lingulodinium_polyedra.AAC.1